MEWYNKSHTARKSIKISITPNYIKMSTYCYEKYFKDLGVSLAYNPGTRDLYLKPDKEEGYKITYNKNDNYLYIRAKKFIKINNILDEKRIVYEDHKWDEENNYLIIHDVLPQPNRNEDSDSTRKL